MDVIEPRLHEVTLYVDNRSLELIPAMTKAEARLKIDSERNRKLYVGGLPHDINKEELKNYFRAFGPLEYANLVYSIGSTLPRGFAFIKYIDEEVAIHVLACKKHSINGSTLFIKWSKTRQEISSKKIDKIATDQITQGQRSCKDQNLRNDNQSHSFTQFEDNSVGYQQGYYPNPPGGYYYQSIDMNMDENPQYQETALGKSFGVNSHQGWQIDGDKMQMSFTPNPQNNMMSDQNFADKNSQQYHYVDAKPKSNSDSQLGYSNLNQMKTNHARFTQSEKYPNSIPNNMQNQQTHGFELSYLQTPSKQMYAQPQNSGSMINMAGTDENPYADTNAYDNDNYVQAPQSQPQNMMMPSSGYIKGMSLAHSPNQLFHKFNVQFPNSQTSIHMIPTRQGSVLNPNEQRRVPLQNQNNQVFYNNRQISNSHCQQQLYGPEYQVSNPTLGQWSAQTNQMGTNNNGYDSYYGYYRPNTRNTLQSHGSHLKNQYSKIDNRPTQPSLGTTHYPSSGFFPPNDAPGDIDQLFCDDFSQLQISPRRQFPGSTPTNQTWNNLSQKSQNEANNIYYDSNYQENPGNPIPGKVHPEQTYYYAPESQYYNNERESIPTGQTQAYGNFSEAVNRLGYAPGQECEKGYASLFSEKEDLEYIAKNNV
jgi:RNA recognition motif-containing protein